MTFESTTPEPTTPESTTPATPPEDVLRGTLFALLAVPVGIIAWCLIWSLGFIASIVAFVVAAAAAWLYRVGARGPISIVGALVVTAVTAVTLVLAFVAGIAVDAIREVSAAWELGWAEVAFAPEFWDFFWAVLPAVLGDYMIELLMALGFGALGCFVVLRSLFAQAAKSAEPAPGANPGVVPSEAAPTSGTDPATGTDAPGSR